MVSTSKSARLAGFMFLIMVVTGLFAEIFFRQTLFVGDAAVAVNNIRSNGFLYRAGIFSDVVMSVAYLFTALMLYKLLVHVHKTMAMVMVLFAACGSVLLLSNILNELAPLHILSGGSPSGALNLAQLQDLAMISYVAYGHGYMIGQVFFALWVLPLGLLIVRSKCIPKALGVLFIVETVCGLTAVAAHFLLPDAALESVLMLPGVVAELLFLLWLLIRGGKLPELPALEA